MRAFGSSLIIVRVGLALEDASLVLRNSGVLMSRRCELTGKAVLVGHKVSHSNHKTKRRFLPNLVRVTLVSDALQRDIRLRVSVNGLRSVEHRGGLDAFLLKASDLELSRTALGLKREIRKIRDASA